jgi:probable HAF family extracellular repeat protein
MFSLHHIKGLCLAATLGLCLLSTTVAHAQKYQFTTLDDTDPGVTNTEPMGINNSGQVSGTYLDASKNDHGFLYSNGTFTTIDDPNQSANPITNQGTQAYHLNEKGQVAGFYGDSNHTDRGFLYSNGTFSTIDDPDRTGSLGTIAEGINNSGDIVGTYFIGSSYSGFVDSGGTFTTIADPSPGIGNTEVTNINNQGEITGRGNTGSGNEGFVYNLSNNTYTILKDPDAANYTAAYGINDSGEVTGTYQDASGNFHGFLATLSGNTYTYTTLNDPNAGTSPNQGTEGIGIDNRGDVVGDYWDSNGKVHGFLATTAPEPGSLAFLGMVALPLIGLSRRRSCVRIDAPAGLPIRPAHPGSGRQAPVHS